MMSKSTADYFNQNSAREHLSKGKENRFSTQNNLNRTSSALPQENRRNTAVAGKASKEPLVSHYQSHREFGKEITNNAASAASRNGSHSTKVSNAPGAS